MAKKLSAKIARTLQGTGFCDRVTRQLDPLPMLNSPISKMKTLCSMTSQVLPTLRSFCCCFIFVGGEGVLGGGEGGSTGWIPE